MKEISTAAARKRGKPFKRIAEPYLYLFPALGLMAAFTYFPFAKTVVTSTFLTNATGKAVEFVGLENYASIFKDPTFIKSIINTFIYTFCQVPVTITIAFFMAVAAGKKRKMSGVYELLFAFSMAVSMSVAALIFKLMLNPQIGAFNYLFKTDCLWFNGNKTAMPAIIILGIWLQVGLDFLFLLAAVRGVSEDLIEAARIDGANFFNELRSVYLPMVSPTLFYLICTNLASSMMMSGQVIVLTKGGPNNATSTIIYYMYKKAFEIYNYGASYAAAIVGFVFAFVMIVLSFRFEKKGVHYN